MRVALGLIALAALVVLQAVTGLTASTLPILTYLLIVAGIAALIVLGRETPALMLTGIALFFALTQAPVMPTGTLARERSFFAVHEVKVTENGQGHLLVHGITVHGAERVRHPDGTAVTGRPEPASYYHRAGAFADAISALRATRGGGPLKVAVIGLGVGSLACYRQEGDAWTFLEIDPWSSAWRATHACSPRSAAVRPMRRWSSATAA